MWLSAIDETSIPEEKLTGYLLSLDHETGRAKARFFMSLGFRPERANQLRGAIVLVGKRNRVSSISKSRFGTKYVVEGRLRGPLGKSAKVRTVWFVELGESRPRFITAYPVGGRKR